MYIYIYTYIYIIYLYIYVYILRNTGGHYNYSTGYEPLCIYCADDNDIEDNDTYEGYPLCSSGSSS